MNKKRILTGIMTGLMMLVLTACGVNNAWEEEEETIELSERIISEDVEVEWELEDNETAGEGTWIRLHITNNNEPIQDFEVNHEKLLHLIIVSKDLSYFNHLHPKYKGNGIFEIDNEFPTGGEYRIVADFKPSNGSAMSKMGWIQVDGKTSEPVAVMIDKVLEKSIDGKKVILSLDHQLEAEKELTLKFTLLNERSNQPISDLEPYLGSIGHVVVFSEDAERYLHVHAMEDQGSGPEAAFETTFPEGGIYKIWSQFQKDGEVFTVPFVIDVP